MDLLGTNSSEFSGMMLGQLSSANCPSADRARTIEHGLAFMAGVQPSDEVQAALGVQMFATHCASVEMGRRMMGADTLQKMDAYGTLATKLARTFTAQAEALGKLRSGGKQQVEVRYVYVDARGSQNVIGDLTGGGGAQDSAALPHAPASLASPSTADVVPMRSKDAIRLALSGAGDQGAEAMPDARRQKPRRAARVS